ncbi:MAG: hypothetical protein WC747_04335 [Candidatus Babeliales bacterium]|jgi:hypothetical protein
MAYSADTFVADEQPTTAKWNKLWANDAAFNDGTGIANNAILTAHIAAANVTLPKISDFDWFKYISGGSFSSTIAGTWTRIGSNTSTGQAGWNAAQSAGAQNEEIQYKAAMAAGTYSVYMHVDKDVNRGIYTTSVDAVSIGTNDSYAATRQANSVLTVSTSLVIATNKLITVNVKMATKNASSAGYYGTINALEFVRTA